jgi:WD40 repeat protein
MFRFHSRGHANKRGHESCVYSLVLLNNGHLASGSADKTIKIWDILCGTVKRTLNGHTDIVYKLVLLANGDLVSGSHDNTIKIWNIEEGSVKRTLIGHSEYVIALKVLDNGDLVSGSGDSTIKIWDVENGTVKKNIKVDSKINSFEVLPNEDLVSATNKSIIIWV